MESVTTLAGIDQALRALAPIVDLPALWEQFTVREVTGGILYWKNLSVYVTVALLFFFLRSREGGARGALEYLLPRSVRQAASFKVDLKFFLADILGVRHLLLVGTSVLLLGQFYVPFVRAVNLAGLPGLSQLADAADGWGTATQTVVQFILVLLGGELGFYLFHRASHRIPLLWQFHKVHHYSQQLNPMVVTRLHFVDDAFQTQCGFVMGALFLSLLFPFEGQDIGSLQQGHGALIAFMLLKKVTARFTHSHIPLSYGPVLDRIVVSPVIHEVHHSREIFDTNFGNILTIWDTLFGTLYRPLRGEVIRFGITEFGDDHYRGFLHCMVEPFRDVVRLLREGKAFKPVPVPPRPPRVLEPDPGA